MGIAVGERAIATFEVHEHGGIRLEDEHLAVGQEREVDAA